VDSYRIKPSVYGTWMLRYTNDKNFIAVQSYLIIQENEIVKLKTVRMNGIFAIKISKTGKIQKIRMNYLQQNMDIDIQFNQVNKYSYSIFGIEIPEFRYDQIKEYKVQRKLSIRESEKMLYIIDKDTKYTYIFDLLLYNTKLPYIEMSIYTFIFTQFVGFFINFGLLHILASQ
jgi:hypothetical protein